MMVVGVKIGGLARTDREKSVANRQRISVEYAGSGLERGRNG